MTRVRQRAEQHGRVVLVDLTDEPLETIGKFVTYALYPTAVYSVIVGVLKNAAKISVGYNPWSGKPCDVDISAICARYGGGGHPFVGAVQFSGAEVGAGARRRFRRSRKSSAGDDTRTAQESGAASDTGFDGAIAPGCSATAGPVDGLRKIRSRRSTSRSKKAQTASNSTCGSTGTATWSSSTTRISRA